jgi:hypothetical protein
MRYTILQGLDALRESTYNAHVVLPLPTGAWTRFIVPWENSSMWTASESHLFPVIYRVPSYVLICNKKRHTAKERHVPVCQRSEGTEFLYLFIYLYVNIFVGCVK